MCNTAGSRPWLLRLGVTALPQLTLNGVAFPQSYEVLQEKSVVATGCCISPRTKSYQDKNAENAGFRWIIQDNPRNFRSSNLDFKYSILDLSLRQVKLDYPRAKNTPFKKTRLSCVESRMYKIFGLKTRSIQVQSKLIHLDYLGFGGWISQ